MRGGGGQLEKRFGKSLCPGRAAAPVFVDGPARGAGLTLGLCGAGGELSRFEEARRAALDRLEGQYRQALGRAGEEGAEIFRLHRAMLGDRDFLDQVEENIQGRGLEAAAAVLSAGEMFSAQFSALEDPYLRDRAADVEEISRLVAGLLSGAGEAPPPAGDYLAAADSLSPSRLMELEGAKGLILRECSPLGHTALLARAMNLPVITGLEPDPAWTGRPAALDGGEGALYLDPDQEVLTQFQEKTRQEALRAAGLAARALGPVCTRSGRAVGLWANAASPEEAARALGNGAQGIGLLRTEFLFLRRDTPPGEEEQLALYRQVIQAMEGRRVVIRTLDLGSDKQAPWMAGPREDNPALGLRGIRRSLARPELFSTQLRAILRAAAEGETAVMFPVVTSPEEVLQARALLDRCRAQLEEENLPAGPVEAGVMIETPAAALLAGELARVSDFFSIGSNDLAQYTLAMDRQDPACDPRHPAVLELIRRAVEGGHRFGRPVSLCGALAADPAMTEELLALGLDGLSVPAEDLWSLRERIEGLG